MVPSLQPLHVVRKLHREGVWRGLAPRAPKKKALARVLVERGLFPDVTVASRWVMTGQVVVDGRRLDKPGVAVSPLVDIRVKGLDRKYVSRGGIKLEHALKQFAMEVAGRVALDAGASTGGFTDCLLQNGAAKVYAVDCGFGQLAGTLRVDPRVVNLERVNIGSLRSETLNPPPSLATLDFSYLSLTKAIPQVAGLLTPEAAIVALIKPRFEVRKNGELTSDDYLTSVTLVAGAGEAFGWEVAGLDRSPILGSRGEPEFLISLKRPCGRPEARADWRALARAVATP